VKERDLFNALLRSDFKSFLFRCMLTLNPNAQFLHNWHIDAISWQLQRVRVGEVTRLIINLPPRYLKSLTVSVIFPAFLLGHNPRLRIFGISYATELSAKHAADFRAIVESSWYRRAFPNMRVARAADSDVFTTKKGFRRSTSVNAALTGFGGDIFIIDDPQKPADALSEPQRNGLTQWFSNTLRSRLDNKEKGIIIIVMQRVHLLDLTGYLTENSDEWTILSLPAISEADEQIATGADRYFQRRAGEALHPAYESLATLQRLRAEVGSDVFAAQYQQAPVPPNFTGAAVARSPVFKVSPIITGNTLMKDTVLAAQMAQSARHASAIEMEFAGVLTACRYVGSGKTRALAVRGLSDIIGYKRSPEWTKFACKTAASLSYTLIAAGLLN
jgi:hypothetical protein